jgi:hypothetical protein
MPDNQREVRNDRLAYYRDAIGPDNSGAFYFAKKTDAEKALRESRADKGDKSRVGGPERIEVNDGDDLGIH